MENNLDLIKKDLRDIKLEITFIKDLILDDESGLEVSDEVVREIEKSRKKEGKDLVSHDNVFKRFCE